MIIGIGTDIIEISRVKRTMERTKLMERFFSENERRYLEGKKAESTAGYFCAKEAVVKALGTGFAGLKWTDIEILKENSVPYPLLHGMAQEIANNKGIKKIHISISHCKEYATSVAVAEG